jgi:anaerobic ribonucleoside-triphosphate reductase
MLSPVAGMDTFFRKRKDDLERSRLKTDMDEEAFGIQNAPLQRSAAEYGLKTDQLSAKQNYEDAQYSSDPARVARRRALEDSMMKVREGILGRMGRRVN